MPSKTPLLVIEYQSFYNLKSGIMFCFDRYEI